MQLHLPELQVGFCHVYHRNVLNMEGRDVFQGPTLSMLCTTEAGSEHSADLRFLWSLPSPAHPWGPHHISKTKVYIQQHNPKHSPSKNSCIGESNSQAAERVILPPSHNRLGCSKITFFPEEHWEFWIILSLDQRPGKSKPQHHLKAPRRTTRYLNICHCISWGINTNLIRIIICMFSIQIG